jgi:hypothetical protein
MHRELARNARGVQLRFGRQEIRLGGGRLFESPDWSNVGRSYDAVRVAAFRPGVKLDLLAGSPVLIDPCKTDRHKPGEHFYVGYLTLTKLVARASIQPYLMARTSRNAVPEAGPAGDARLYTAGVRWEGKLPARLDYAAEVVRQWGPWSGDRISALAGTYTVGWTTSTSGWKPRLTLDVNHASGDGRAGDGTRGTFDQMYAGNHNSLGITDQFGWKNMRMAKVGIELAPSKKWKATGDFREMYLATTQDGLYTGNGTRAVLNRGAHSRHVGAEADLTMVYQFNRVWSAGTGVGRIFAGAYLAESSKGGDYTYPFLFWPGRF